MSNKENAKKAMAEIKAIQKKYDVSIYSIITVHGHCEYGFDCECRWNSIEITPEHIGVKESDRDTMTKSLEVLNAIGEISYSHVKMLAPLVAKLSDDLKAHAFVSGTHARNNIPLICPKCNEPHDLDQECHECN